MQEYFNRIFDFTAGSAISRSELDIYTLIIRNATGGLAYGAKVIIQ
jgi:hypothetical protein